MKKLLFFIAILIVGASPSLAYTTSNAQMNITLYPVYGSSIISNTQMNSSFEVNYVGYFIGSSSLNATISIFPWDMFPFATTTTIPSGAGNLAPYIAVEPTFGRKLISIVTR